MSDEVEEITTKAIKTASDGTVKIAVEKYNEMLEMIASQKGSISGLKDQLTRLQNEPPVINRTVVNKTAEMLTKENRLWGNTLMGVGASLLVVGVYRRMAS